MVIKTRSPLRTQAPAIVRTRLAMVASMFQASRSIWVSLMELETIANLTSQMRMSCRSPMQSAMTSRTVPTASAKMLCRSRYRPMKTLLVIPSKRRPKKSRRQRPKKGARKGRATTAVGAVPMGHPTQVASAARTGRAMTVVGAARTGRITLAAGAARAGHKTQAAFVDKSAWVCLAPR